MKDLRIVNLRAFAIIIVVLGHSIILYDPSWGIMHTSVEMPLFQHLKEGISFIQMKLFFSISGFLLYYQYKNGKLGSWLNFVKKKAIRLLIPYLMIAILWMNPIKILLNVPGYDFTPKLLIKQIVGLECGHLWFLPTLAIIFMLVFALLKLNERWFQRSKDMGIWAILCLFIVLNAVHSLFPSILMISNSMDYAVYFYYGFFLNHVLNSVKIGAKIFILLSLVSVCTYHIHYKIFELFASFALLTLCYVIVPNKTSKSIAMVSDNSYGIYLFHSPMIYITYTFMANANPWMVVGLNFVIFGFAAMLMTIFINKTRFRFIIGNR